MENLLQLHCRIAELETALRHKDEQLAEARTATTFLLRTISKQEGRDQHGIADSLQAKLDHKTAENAHLRAALDFIGNDTHQSNAKRHLPISEIKASYTALGLSDQRKLTHHGLPPSPPFTDEQSPRQEARQEIDLLSFEHGDCCSLSEERPFLTASNAPLAAKSQFGTKLNGEPFGLGISSGQGELQRGIAPGRKTAAGNEQHIDTLSPVLHSDGSTSFVTLTRSPPHVSKSISSCPDTAQSRFQKPAPFADHEWRSLMGMAFFIEAMGPEEQAEFWVRYAMKGRQRHAADEWQAYYKSEVRPQYLAKSNAGDAAAGNGSETDGDDELIETHETTIQKAASDPGKGEKPVGDATPVDLPERPQQEQGLAASKCVLKTDSSCESASKIAFLPTNQAEMLSGDTMAAMPSVTTVQQGTAKSMTENHELSGKLDYVVVPRKCEGSGPECVGQSLGCMPMSSFTSSQNTSESPALQQRDVWKAPQDVSDLWTYHQRFHPEGHKHLFRTVLVSALPLNITLAKVLEKVRGGKVVGAKMIETGLMRTNPAMDTNIVKITFLGEGLAQNYVDFCNNNTVFGRDTPFQAKVDMHPFRSATLSPGSLREIYGYGMTRVLYIHDNGRWEPEDLINQLVDREVDRQRVCTRPLRACRDQDGLMVLDFASIEEAANAWHVIERNGFVFGGVGKGFLPDPCAQPLESLIVGFAACRPIIAEPALNK